MKTTITSDCRRIIPKPGKPSNRVLPPDLQGNLVHLGCAGILDATNVESLCTYYRIVFAVFREFVRKRCPMSLEDSHWSILEEGIRKDPARFTDRDHFKTLSKFFGITLLSDR